MVVKEKSLSPQSFGKNNQVAVDVHIDYALRQKKYRAWGMSPCSIPTEKGGYGEYGVSILGVKGYSDKAVITPHVSFLALDIRPEEVIVNLKSMLTHFPIYGKYGFYDAVNVLDSKVSYRYLALDQAMSFIAMNNFLNEGIIRERFHKDPYIKNIENLLTEEEFF